MISYKNTWTVGKAIMLQYNAPTTSGLHLRNKYHSKSNILKMFEYPFFLKLPQNI